MSVAARRPPETIVRAALLTAALLVCACRTSRPPMHPEGLAGQWVTVAEGETLDTLARRAGVPPEDLLEANGLSGPSQIHPGMTIFLLQAAPAVAAAPVDPNRPPSLRWPLTTIAVTVGSPFGARWGKPHEGIDLPAPVGTPVFAAADGTVVYSGHGIRGYGNLIVIKHTGDLLTVYAHNSALLVSQGQPVRAGDRIALVGQSGHATGPHLHFEVRSGQIPIDPMPYLPRLP
ncbi:MAG TPA: LysM peptidoglycan-binding domain-containing M23 family metallopeptidase [Polyangia bacterium]|nr:LysM peptidoglycan-binding domain-containing M23 family metallopeptidase [Polyangia bacterium]